MSSIPLCPLRQKLHRLRRSGMQKQTHTTPWCLYHHLNNKQAVAPLCKWQECSKQPSSITEKERGATYHWEIITDNRNKNAWLFHLIHVLKNPSKQKISCSCPPTQRASISCVALFFWRSCLFQTLSPCLCCLQSHASFIRKYSSRIMAMQGGQGIWC